MLAPTTVHWQALVSSPYWLGMAQKETPHLHKMRVIDSRPGLPNDPYYRYRRYKCEYCDQRFTTYEYTEDLISIMRDQAVKYKKIQVALNQVEEK